jgi:hypothetical protein
LIDEDNAVAMTTSATTAAVLPSNNNPNTISASKSYMRNLATSPENSGAPSDGGNAPSAGVAAAGVLGVARSIGAATDAKDMWAAGDAKHRYGRRRKGEAWPPMPRRGTAANANERRSCRHQGEMRQPTPSIGMAADA